MYHNHQRKFEALGLPRKSEIVAVIHYDHPHISRRLDLSPGERRKLLLGDASQCEPEA
jgi:hypothetical protein